MNAPPEFTDAHAAWLEAFLSAPQRPEGTMSYCELAGFLFAVACAPDLVQPSEWLPVVFNDQNGNFQTLDEAREILPAIMALYNHAVFGANARALVLPPRCLVRADPIANLEPDAPLSQWARGFGGGHDWLELAWDEYLPESLDEELGLDLLVLTFFANRKLAEAYREEMKRTADSLEEVAADLLAAFPDAMHSYANVGRSIFEAVVAEAGGESREPVRREKIGRNDPCPCGSGEKYKKCCGAALH